jgi:hypothetical protein
MRCGITKNVRAAATPACGMPRRLVTFMSQAASRPFGAANQQQMGCFIQRGSSRLVTASADPAHAHQFRRVCDAGPSSRGARRRFTICKSNPAYNPSFLATYCLLETGIPNRRARDVVTRPANGGKTLVVMPAPHRSGVLDERRLRYRQTPVNMRRAAALRRLTANAAARRSTRIGQHGTPQL